jgi:hypothetical protein
MAGLPGRRVGRYGRPVAPTGLETLTDFFTRSPAAARALRALRPGAAVALELAEGPAGFRPGGAPVTAGQPDQPDFTLRLPVAALQRLCADPAAGVGALGVQFFTLVVEHDPALRVEVRLEAPTTRLLAHGWLAVLALGGVEVALWLLRRGLADPRAALERLRRRGARPAEPADKDRR